MRVPAVLLACSVFATGPSAAAGFFFFIAPGVNGERHCISSAAQVGDRVTIPGQGAAMVISVAGPSPRCTDARYPHLAALDFGRGDVVLPQGQELTECVGAGARVGDKLTLSGVGEVVVKGTRTAGSQCPDMKYPLQATVIKPWAIQPPTQAAPSPSQSSAPAAPGSMVLPVMDRPNPAVSSPTPSAPAQSQQTAFARQLCVFQTSKVGDAFYDAGVGKGVITNVLGPWTDCTDPTAPYRATVQFQGVEPAVPAPQVLTATQSKPATTDAAQKLRELNGLLKDGVITQDDYDAKKRELLKAF